MLPCTTTHEQRVPFSLPFFQFVSNNRAGGTFVAQHEEEEQEVEKEEEETQGLEDKLNTDLMAQVLDVSVQSPFHSLPLNNISATRRMERKSG